MFQNPSVLLQNRLRDNAKDSFRLLTDALLFSGIMNLCICLLSRGDLGPSLWVEIVEGGWIGTLWFGIEESPLAIWVCLYYCVLYHLASVPLLCL